MQITLINEIFSRTFLFNLRVTGRITLLCAFFAQSLTRLQEGDSHGLETSVGLPRRRS
jgi:hypothetical protein